MKVMASVLLSLATLGPRAYAQDPPADEMKPGLIAEFFSIGKAMEEFPTLAAERKPDYRRIDGKINLELTSETFDGSTMAVQFYVRWNGRIKIPRDAKYTFFTESDDGSRLWIDGKVVVDNGGVHPMEEKSGDVDLKAGEHDIKIELFQNDGLVGCKVSWEYSSAAKEIIPDSVLVHKKDKDLDK